MDDVVDGGVGQRERGHDPLPDDELGLHLDRLAGPLLAIGQHHEFADGSGYPLRLGNERIAPNNRGWQHGPVAGMGQRPNAQGYDLNRDHMKLESPEARSLASLFNRYDPHVGIDLHTTNGTRHAYHLTYSPPLNPNTDAGIINLLRGEWFPHVTKQVKAKHGWEYFYYGNVPGPAGPDGGPRGWYTFEHVPRFNNNYIGLRNRFALLSEAYAYLTFEDRIKATSRFVEENLNYAHGHASAIRRMLGQGLPFRRTVPVRVAESITLGPTLQHFLRAVVTAAGDGPSSASVNQRPMMGRARKVGPNVFCFIADELVFQLCDLVCDRLRKDLQAKASQFIDQK